MYALSLWLLLHVKLDPLCSFTDGSALSSHAKDLQHQNRSLSLCNSIRADVILKKLMHLRCGISPCPVVSDRHVVPL